uniref:Uncharacterized protein n=1 Tax=Rhizophora mucronata TaxID=61149 RepID=A0A2P2K6S2_RHIMU
MNHLPKPAISNVLKLNSQVTRQTTRINLTK